VEKLKACTCLDLVDFKVLVASDKVASSDWVYKSKDL